jgi:hypothetical protein
MMDRSFCHKRARPNMPQEENGKAMSEACKFCSDKGLDGMGPAMSILLNEAMASERSGALNPGLI